MSIRPQDIDIVGSASMPDDDSILNIGGAKATSVRVGGWGPLNASDNIQVVSDNAGDITQTVTVDALNAPGEEISEGKVLNGQTPVVMTVNTNWRWLLKAIKSATTAGTIAVETVTAERANTAQAGDAESITLDAAASAVDNAYNGMVVRITAGTGAGQIRRAFDYIGASKKLIVSRDWSVNPDDTSVFRISRGMVFEKGPNEIMEVRRAHYLAVADALGGVTRDYFDKFFLENLHGTLTLTSAVVKEVTDSLGKFDFALETSLNGTDTNGAGNNRQVAPGGYTFDSTDKNVANTQNHTAGAGQGVWARLRLSAGDVANAVVWDMRESGISAP